MSGAMDPDLLFFQAGLNYVNTNDVEDPDTDYEVVLGDVRRWIANGTSVEFNEWSKGMVSSSSALQNVLDGWEYVNPPRDLITTQVLRRDTSRVRLVAVGTMMPFAAFNVITSQQFYHFTRHETLVLAGLRTVLRRRR